MPLKVIQRLRNDGCLWQKFSPHRQKILLDAQGKVVPARFVWPWWLIARGSVRVRLQRALLPEDYPASVHHNYLAYSGWNFVHMIFSSTMGVLSTQSLLFGLGLSSGTSSLALSSTINWILKDGLGQLGGIGLVAYLGGRFDVQAQRYRFLAAVFLKISCFLEMLVPLWPQGFILTAALANVVKNVSWMATSATRAQIQRHFALRDNLGDISGKTASQNTLASLIGTGLGVLVSSLFLSGSGIPAETIVMRCLVLSVPLSLMSLWMCYQSCTFAISPRITLSRFHTLCRHLFAEVFSRRSLQPCQETLGQLKRYILCPETIVRREPILFRPVSPVVPVLIDPDVLDLVLDDAERDCPFWIRLKEDSTISIWFAVTAHESDILRGLFSVELIRHFMSQKIPFAMASIHDLVSTMFPVLETALVDRGWCLDDINVGLRRPIRILTDQDD